MKKSLIFSFLIIFILGLFSGCEVVKSGEYYIAVDTKSDYRNVDLILPKDAILSLFSQKKYYKNEKVEPSAKKNYMDSTKYSFKLKEDDGTYFYRIERDNSPTKAGYIPLNNSKNYRFNFDFKKLNFAFNKGSYIENGLLLNVNAKGCLSLKKGENYMLRAFRTTQIVNNEVSNIIIEPDFNFTILSGDSVLLEKKANDKLEIKAVKSGVSILEVTYDEIEIIQGDKAMTYCKTDENRKGLVVIDVDGKNNDNALEDEKIENLPNLDAEFDTVYFNGEVGSYFIDAPVSKNAKVEVYVADKLLLEENGGYMLPIKNGNNIFKFKANKVEEYLVIRGKQVLIKMENQDGKTEDFKDGDTIKIHFSGLYLPVCKLAGVYNPGYNDTIKTSYIYNGNRIFGKGFQYDFITENILEIKLDKLKNITLTDGLIGLTSMGDSFGGHRGINDAGLDINFDAKEVAGNFSILPDIEFFKS